MRGRLRWSEHWIEAGGLAIATSGLGVGAILAAGLFYAEGVARQDSPSALRQALRIETWLTGSPNADYEERLAELFSEAESGPPEQALRQTVRIDPKRSAAWIALGLLVEQNGERAEAEQDLLQAARIDHQYLPAWTLTNFYFRRGNRDLFWKWARCAALLTYDESPALLRLVEHFDQAPLSVLARLGDTPGLERGYLSYLIGEKRLSAAQQVALCLAVRRDPRDARRMADLASRQILAAHPAEAQEAWNLFHAPALDPAHGQILTDPAFRSPPSGEGFDWTLGPRALCAGEATSWSPGQLEFNFSGGQPEDCILLSQVLILAPGHRYRLRFAYRCQGLPSASGLEWDLALSDPTGAPLLDPSGAISSLTLPSERETWVVAQRVFPDARETFVRLRLLYHRQPGTVRYRGSVWLRDLHLEVS